LKIQWTKAASDDLESIHDYIFPDSPIAAAEQVKRVVLIVEEHLSLNPWAGRVGRLHDTREYAVNGTPYIVIYRVRNEVLEVIRVLHGARQWPPKC
jgi:toxin ParE1/3/4